MRSDGPSTSRRVLHADGRTAEGNRPDVEIFSNQRQAAVHGIDDSQRLIESVFPARDFGAFPLHAGIYGRVERCEDHGVVVGEPVLGALRHQSLRSEVAPWARVDVAGFRAPLFRSYHFAQFVVIVSANDERRGILFQLPVPFAKLGDGGGGLVIRCENRFFDSMCDPTPPEFASRGIDERPSTRPSARATFPRAATSAAIPAARESGARDTAARNFRSPEDGAAPDDDS